MQKKKKGNKLAASDSSGNVYAWSSVGIKVVLGAKRRILQVREGTACGQPVPRELPGHGPDTVRVGQKEAFTARPFLLHVADCLPGRNQENLKRRPQKSDKEGKERMSGLGKRAKEKKLKCTSSFTQMLMMLALS
jgi:hypothetical protein